MSAHVELAELVDYFSGDLESSREADVEEHLMGCGACTAEGTRISAIASGLRAFLPPLATEAVVLAMRKRGLRVEENPMGPGETTSPVLGPSLDVMIHRLRGVDPAATSAKVELRVVETGDLLVAIDEVPNLETGDVLLVCSPHYASFPPNIRARIITQSAAGESTTEYVIQHRFIVS